MIQTMRDKKSDRNWQSYTIKYGSTVPNHPYPYTVETCRHRRMMSKCKRSMHCIGKQHCIRHPSPPLKMCRITPIRPSSLYFRNNGIYTAKPLVATWWRKRSTVPTSPPRDTSKDDPLRQWDWTKQVSYNPSELVI